MNKTGRLALAIAGIEALKLLGFIATFIFIFNLITTWEHLSRWGFAFNASGAVMAFIGYCGAYWIHYKIMRGNGDA